MKTKNFYLLVLLLVVSFISSTLTAQQKTYIPDNNFEKALIDLGYDNVLDNYITTSNIINVTNLDVRSKDISNLTGIESFTGLISLNITFNQINQLNVTNNTKLKELYCAFNDLESLDLNKNTALTYLDCGFNKLDVLDVQNNTALTVLYADHNNLVDLNVKNGNNVNFINFDVTNNTNLKCIEVDNAVYSLANWLNKDTTSSYDCDGNSGSQDLTHVPDNNFEQALIALGYDTVLDDYVTTANISKVTSLDVSDKSINDLTGIEAFTALTSLNCRKNNLSVLDLSNNLSLTYLNCSLNSISSLDVSKNVLLTNLICFYNNLVTLDVKNGNNINFTNFDARYNTNLKCIQVDNATYSNTNWLRKEAGAIFSVNCNGDSSPGLTYVPDNNFEQALIALGYDTILDDYVTTANINKVTVLDVSDKSINDLTGIEAFTALTSLNCRKNNLSVLDLSNNLSLTYLNCSLNSISSLDVSKNVLLTNLICFYNNLVTLDVKNGNNINFTDFDARYNTNLKCIQVDNATYSNTNWLKKEADAIFSVNCNGDSSPELTYVPDNNFEQALIALGYDTILDDYVATINISSVEFLDVANRGIKDLTGIEAFSSLTTLDCSKNSLSSLDLSNNLSLIDLKCSVNSLTNLDLSKNVLLTNLICFYNNLITLDVKNGNNRNFLNFDARYNPTLSCIKVDDVTYSTVNWLKKDATANYNIDCGGLVFAKSSSSSKAVFSDDESLSTQPQQLLDKSNFKIYPNPVNDVLNINLDYGIKMQQVNFYNAYGQRVFSANTNKIDVSNFAKGIYFVEIETNQGKSTKKVVVE
ncbi:T9SS type A sorting domain-containing protein [Mariniflexile sp. HMF6888]|uniref:T9SS type A sorting domain-containing protein n=1 Tax=Mariniflexile sp. HMF6888 TaxID=3373086 RepID=UPI0037A1BBC1